MSNRPRAKTTSSARVAQARRSSAARGVSPTWWIVGGVAVVVAIALIIAIAAGSRSGDAGDIAWGDVTVSGTALPVAPQAGGADPAVGKTVPEVKGQLLDGKPVTIPASGTPKVVMFLAHWCPHCQKEVPLLTSYLSEKGMPAGVDLYAVSTGTDDKKPNFPPAAWLRNEKWPVRTMADNGVGKAAEAYGVGGFPYFVAVDAQGKVVARTSGEISMEQFQQLIDQARQPSPPT